MSKQRKLIKKLGILFVMLILSVTVLSTTVASADDKLPKSDTYIFNLDILANGDLCRTSNKEYRDTKNIDDGWGVHFTYSNERANYQYTATKFWLGIYKPIGYNEVGSNKHTVVENSKWQYFSATAAASKKYVYLYASDNLQTNPEYSVRGDWCPYSGQPAQD